MSDATNGTTALSPLDRAAMPATVREATLEDLPAIGALGQEVNFLHHQALPTVFASEPAADAIAQHWREGIESPNACTLVAEVAGQVVAFVSVFLVHDTHPLMQPSLWARVGTIGVHGPYRRQGLGRLLMQAAEQWAVQRGAGYLRLNVWAFNAAAQQWYAALGYGADLHTLGKVLKASE